MAKFIVRIEANIGHDHRAHVTYLADNERRAYGAAHMAHRFETELEARAAMVGTPGHWRWRVEEVAA